MDTKNTPLLSVIVVTYNHANYIGQCLDGILMQQTNFPFEIILGEDESSDGTREICQEYAERFPQNIKLLLQSREDVLYINDRPTGRANYIACLNECKGKYIAQCEGDDYWTDPLKLQKQVDFLEHNDSYVVCYHDASVIDQHGNAVSDSKLKKNYKKDFTYNALKKAPLLIFHSMCYRNVLKEFPSQFYEVINGDSFIISMLGNYGDGKYMDEIVPSVHRQHSGGMWTSIKQLEKISLRLRFYENCISYYRELKDNETVSYFNLQGVKTIQKYLTLTAKNPVGNHFFLGLKKYFEFSPKSKSLSWLIFPIKKSAIYFYYFVTNPFRPYGNK